MNETHIQAIGEHVFHEKPIKIIRQKIGICNEVFEIVFRSKSYILRINKEKNILYGTHRHLPLFKALHIPTPDIIAEDYSKEHFPFCYQILSKIEGKDLGLVIENLSHSDLREIAGEVSLILDKFNSLPATFNFGNPPDKEDENPSNLWEWMENRQKTVLARNEQLKVLDDEILDLFDGLIQKHKAYFLSIEPKWFYDDISAKNVMIHKGKFTGLVDLDFLSKGDYLSAIGSIIACWHGEEYGEIYVNEIIERQGLDKVQQNIIRLYAISDLILWTSEEGIQFNSNSSGSINWDNVKQKRKKIIEIAKQMQTKVNRKNE